VPEKKLAWGYRFQPRKFETAGLTPVPSVAVAPPRIAECPVQMEGIVHGYKPFGKNVGANAFEVHILKLHVEESLLEGFSAASSGIGGAASQPHSTNAHGPRPHIDAARWRPLIMSFCRFFGLGGEVHPSRLAASDFMKFVLNGAPAPQAAPPAPPSSTTLSS
jgi:flavin reductase (DIM6/NTAB) family NADH-FMN oxidoreductase RutF